MLNILIGAGIGALVNAGAYCAIQLWKGQPITWKPLAAAVVGGAVAGALAGTTFGASLLVGSATGAAEFLAFDGAAASGAEKLTANALDKKALGDGVPEAMAWGAITAPATGLVLRGVGTQISNMIAEATPVAAAGADAAAGAGADVAADAGAATSSDAGAASASAKPAPLPLTHHIHAPTAHVLGTTIANAAFGSPWVGEGVNVAKQSSGAQPVNPNTGASGTGAITPVSPTSGTSSSTGSSTTSTAAGPGTGITTGATGTGAAPTHPLTLVPLNPATFHFTPSPAVVAPAVVAGALKPLQIKPQTGMVQALGQITAPAQP